MIPNFLRWIFVKYNQKLNNDKEFENILEFSELINSVNIYRDKWHIPHIYSQNEQDLFFAQGYIHAQDRMWQMELNRRTGQGRLAEIFGQIALNTDRLTRTLGFNRLAIKDWELISNNDKKNLISYSEGVNAWMSKRQLPIEFKITRVKPQEWSPLDTLAWSRVMMWTLSHGWSGTLTRNKIINRVGSEMAKELKVLYPNDNPIEIYDNDLSFDIDEMTQSAQGPFLKKDMEGGGRGSNAWAISGERSESGRPILCNDTHLVLSVPSIWYLNHLYSDNGYHCVGSTIPGLPGVLIGHNNKIAWGITLAYIDVEDIFIEKLDVTDPERYIYKNSSKSFEYISELISVKGEKDHIENVKYTIHGPLIGSTIGSENQVISLCSKALNPSKSLSGFFQVNRADNWRLFAEAIKQISSTQLNFVYADIDNNIGLYVSGRVPIRKNGQGDVVCPGWNGEFDWIDEIPHEHMPNVLNPSSGYIISCNNKVVGHNYPYFLGNSFMNGNRAKRIESIFDKNKKLSKDLCLGLHMDVYSIVGEKLVNGLIKKFRTAKPKAQHIIDILTKWDFLLNKESIGATVYQVFVYKLIKRIIEPYLGKDLTIKYLGEGTHPILLPVNELLGNAIEAIFNILKNPSSKWVKSKKEALNIIENSMVETCIWLENNLGNDPMNWEWGSIHTATFIHSFSQNKILDKIFSLGPFPIGGDTDTVHQTAYNPNSPFKATAWSPVNRFYYDIGEWDNSLTILPPGQSGVLGSKHFDDMLIKWYKGEYIPLYWSKKIVKKNAVKTLKFITKN